MDGRDGGYIYLHRRLRDWPLWEAWSAEHRQVWIEMLFQAAYRNREVWTMQGRATLHRGEFCTTQVELARLAKVSRKVVRSVYAALLAEGAISTRVLGNAPGRGGAHQVVATTIQNYSKYQDKPEKRGHQKATEGPDQKKGKEGRKTASSSDRDLSSTQSPPMEGVKGEEGTPHITNLAEWHLRREEELTRKYGLWDADGNRLPDDTDLAKGRR